MITKKIELDLSRKGITPVVDAVQGDSGIFLAFSLFADGTPWVVPAGAQVIVQYGKDGFGGTYDSLPDGSAAWQSDENVLTVALAPQVCTLWGDVTVQIAIYSGERRISTFAVILRVEKTVAWEREPEAYTNLTQWLLKHENASAEVLDLRSGFDGKTYGYAGTAVRSQIGELWRYMPESVILQASGDILMLKDSAASPVRELKVYIPENTKGVKAVELTARGKNIATMDFRAGRLRNGRAYVYTGEEFKLPYASAAEDRGLAITMPCKAGVTYKFSANMALPNAYVNATVYDSVEDTTSYTNAVKTFYEGYNGSAGKGFTCDYDGVMVVLFFWKWSNGSTNAGTFPAGYIPYVAAEAVLSDFEAPVGNTYKISLPEIGRAHV